VALIVQKFGGTSVGSVERIRNVARRVAKWKAAGHDLVVVPSAMAGETNRLIALARELQAQPDPRELDVVATTGEQVTIGLLCMALMQPGVRARSYTGWQVKVLTDSAFTRARIISIDEDAIRQDLAAGVVAVVAGFQGVDERGSITTLGRGGSDTTAVAVAAALNADVCEIYTDVDGVFSADPRIVPDARKLPVVSFEEMLEMAASGARVLQLRSVEYARNYGVRIHVRPSFGEGSGTLVLGEEETMERPLVTGVTHSTADARVTLTGVPDRPGIAARIFRVLADADVNVDMIVQNEPVSADQRAEISFTLPKDDLSMARRSLESLVEELELDAVIADEQMGKVSIVGAGMRSHPGVAARVFETISEQDINIEMISTSPIKISCVIAAARVPDAVRALHEAFGLGAEDVRPEDPYGAAHRPSVSR